MGSSNSGREQGDRGRRASSSYRGDSEATTRRLYITRGDDTLRKIALRFYGDEQEWRRIYEANAGAIHDLELLPPGLCLSIPEI